MKRKCTMSLIHPASTATVVYSICLDERSDGVYLSTHANYVPHPPTAASLFNLWTVSSKVKDWRTGVIEATRLLDCWDREAGDKEREIEGLKDLSRFV